jgi:lipoprotein-anchoring transpeptidase ErfK/SrfK
MRQQYRRQSFSAWVFWGALVIGGTLYGAYRFDWFPIGFPSPAAAPAEMASAKPAPNAEKAPAQSPPDGQIEVAQSPAGPQSEPPPSEFDEPGPGAKSDQAKSTKARLLEQRAEGPAPRLRANASTPSSVEPANIADIEASRSPFNLDSNRDNSNRDASTRDGSTRDSSTSSVAASSATASSTAAAAATTIAPPPAKVGPVVQAANIVEEKEAPLKETAPMDPDLELQLEKIDRLLKSDDLLRAHRELSTIYWAKPHWRPNIRERIERTAHAIYFDPQPQFLQPYVVKANDQFAVFAKRYNVPWQYLAKLNGVDPKKIRPGQQLKVIKGPFSAIVELNRYLLTLHAYGYYVRAFTIGIGKDGATPLGKFTVLNKVTNPQYTDPEGHVIDGGDPNNPLGERWLDLGKGYGIHGTIAPNSIGKAESRGCIRLRNEDVEEVYDMLAVGSEVTIRR